MEAPDVTQIKAARALAEPGSTAVWCGMRLPFVGWNPASHSVRPTSACRPAARSGWPSQRRGSVDKAWRQPSPWVCKVMHAPVSALAGICC